MFPALLPFTIRSNVTQLSLFENGGLARLSEGCLLMDPPTPCSTLTEI